MYEIKYNDLDIFEDMIADRNAPRDGEYDFTFENRYLLYHVQKGKKLHYVAYDLLTDREYDITTTKSNAYLENTYTRLIPLIIERTRKHVNRNCTKEMVERPFEMIDLIFRFILPENGYSVREEQIELCKQMYNGFRNKQVSVCEAEVGTGKTLAYLVAGLLARKYNAVTYNSKEPVTIATATIELQTHLLEKEIPQLSCLLYSYGLIDQPLKAVLMKGRKHYFCQVRYNDYFAGLQQYPGKNHWKIQEVLSVGSLPRGADLDQYHLEEKTKRKICVDGFCGDCSSRDTCVYMQQMYEISQDFTIDFQVVNHNLYLAGLRGDMRHNGIMHSSGLVVIDEAHNFKNTADEMFGERLSENDIPHYIGETMIECDDRDMKHQHREALSRLRAENSALFEELRFAVANTEESMDVRNDVDILPHHHRRLNALALLLIECERFLPDYNGEFSRCGKALAEKLSMLVRTKDHLYWCETAKNGSLSLCCTPTKITDIMYDFVWNQTASHVLTSGTMSDGNGFEFFIKENGLDKVPQHLLSTTRVKSPFNYKQNARLYIPADLPMPDNTSREYTNAIADHIEQLVYDTNGHTAILFTSYEVLRVVYTMLKHRLSKYELFHMKPGDKTVIQRFKKSKNGVLFASGSMWEGVDCAGDCLSSVIIVRLPFPTRTPRLEIKKELCDSCLEFIENYCVPSMVLKLRQGIGRLIRTETDTGVVSILDPRIRNPLYRGSIRKALINYPVLHSVEEVEQFIHDVKCDEYFEGDEE